MKGYSTVVKQSWGAMLRRVVSGAWAGLARPLSIAPALLTYLLLVRELVSGVLWKPLTPGTISPDFRASVAEGHWRGTTASRGVGGCSLVLWGSETLLAYGIEGFVRIACTCIMRGKTETFFFLAYVEQKPPFTQPRLIQQCSF